MLIERVLVKAPSTTANLGPGFDVFGLALDLFYDVVEVTRVNEGISMEVLGKYAAQIPIRIENNTAGVAAKAFLKKYNIDGGVNIKLKKGIKPSVGLGSSAASAAATAVALNKLFETGLSNEEIAEIAAQGEIASAGAPHADNVSSAIFGGFTIVRRESRLRVIKLEPPVNLRVAVLIPHTSTIDNKTRKAREVLPKVSPLGLVVENVGNACGIVAGFILSDIDLIGECMINRLVETARAKFVPFYNEVRERALESGAVGVAISGAGPSIIALIDSEKHEAWKVASAMQSVFEEAGVDAEVYVAEPSKGAEVLVLE